VNQNLLPFIVKISRFEVRAIDPASFPGGAGIR
jgi:hypothetical protein